MQREYEDVGRICVATTWLVASALAAASGEAFGGAWTLDAGTGEAMVTATASQASRAFDASRSLVGTADTTKFELQALVEYGASDWATLIFSPSLQHIAIGAPVSASRSGPGYTDVGARLRLLQGDDWVFSAQTLVRLPGTRDMSNPAAAGYRDSEAELRALFGTNFQAGAWPAFVDVEIAHRWRAGPNPNEWRFDVTLGLEPAPRWLLLLQNFNVISAGAVVPAPSYDYSKLQISARYDLTEQWALQAGVFTTFAGRNALQENGVLVAVWYRFGDGRAAPSPQDR